MALGYRQNDPVRDGTLEVDQVDSIRVDVFFVPPDHSLTAAGLDPKKARSYRTKLLEINGKDPSITIHPISTFGDKDDFLKSKYRQIECVILEDTGFMFPEFDDKVPSTLDQILEILEDFPSAFTKDYAFGLGLAKPYRFIIDAVEELTDCTEIVVTGKRDTGPASNEKRFYISKKDFELARRSMNSIGNLAQTAVRAVRGAAKCSSVRVPSGLHPGDNAGQQMPDLCEWRPSCGPPKS